MADESLQKALAGVPAGAWAVGVSGGADSVALLSLLRIRSDLSLHVVHLDHQTRGQESTEDARFVCELARGWNLACTCRRRDEIEPMLSAAPANPSALYRALRLEVFRQVVRQHALNGVILAHHADDQAETVLQRLLRGSTSAAGLAGMRTASDIGELRVLRPLLNVRREALRQYLRPEGIGWREDSSNLSDRYQRNRLRPILDAQDSLRESLIELAEQCAALRDWTTRNAPELEAQFRAAQLARLPRVLSAESARRWLLERGVPPEEIEPAVIERLLTMARDAASPSRLDFPGAVRVRRRGGRIFVDQG